MLADEVYLSVDWMLAVAGNVDGVRSHIATSDAQVMQTAEIRLWIGR